MAQPRSGSRTRKRSRSRVVIGVAALVAAGAVVGGVLLGTQQSAPVAAATASPVGYATGTPGPGSAAPDFTLRSTSGGNVTLSAFRGKTVLLYFHEGIGCQSCWDQIRDLEKSKARLQAAGVDQLLTITSGPVNLIAQKMADDHLTATALADTDLAVSRTYNANQYGMMGDSRNGHSFILVGPDGRIQWRADYGGAPDYTMYVPVRTLLADLRSGRVKG